MKQFKTIFTFELTGYIKNKIFVGVTVFLVAVLAVVMFFPRIREAFKSEDVPGEEDASRPVMLVVPYNDADGTLVRDNFAAFFPDYRVELRPVGSDVETPVTSGEAECAFVMTGASTFTYYVENLSMYDANTAVAQEALQTVVRMQAMAEAGMTGEQIAEVYSVGVEAEVKSLGVDQTRNFLYTYVMIMALYMVILLYGQMVASNVASEKASRAMEVLITSARPVSMMFGKVLASCAAGLMQLVAVFGSAILFFNLNKSYWDAGGVISSLFNMPVSLLLYMLLFFVLGFFIFAFLFGAVGSTASKLEDINTSVMPITLLFIVGFLVVMISMSSGDVDSLLMRVCSYIPFTSPMAMFTRIAMSVVPAWEIILSVAILIGSVAGVGVLAAKIYRVGVLLYGTTPKPKDILKAIRRS